MSRAATSRDMALRTPSGSRRRSCPLSSIRSKALEEYPVVDAVVPNEIERGHAVVIAGHSFAVDDARARAQARATPSPWFVAQPAKEILTLERISRSLTLAMLIGLAGSFWRDGWPKDHRGARFSD